MTEEGDADGSGLTVTALWGTFLALVLIPFAFFFMGPVASGGWLVILLIGLIGLCILLILAIVGLGDEIEVVREELERLREERAPAETEPTAPRDG